MRRNMRWRLLLIGCVLTIALWQIYPTARWASFSKEEKEAMSAEESDRWKEKAIRLGLDLRGGMDVLLEVETEGLGDREKEEVVRQVRDIIGKRIDQLGVAECPIYREGDNWLRIQFPGVEDPERMLKLMGKTALLEFKLVSDDVNKLKAATSGKKLEGFELKYLEKEPLILYEKSLLTGKDLQPTARVDFGGGFGEPHVNVEFKPRGAKRFTRITADNVGKRLAILLDGVVQLAPVIKTKIPDGRAVIEGNYTIEEANDTAIVLRAGALPSPVKIIQNTVVGPSLGLDSIRKGVAASIVGGALVIVFMLVYYRWAGLVTDIGLVANLIMLLGVLAGLDATLTLPGIAGIILMVGISVDANVLIFERIREELHSGKSTSAAIKGGYTKALSSILDSQLTTLLAAIVLFWFGTRQVKGFATTLSIGIAANLFTVLVIIRTFFDTRIAYRSFRVLGEKER